MHLAHRASEFFPGASFAIAHCNFALRGEESDGDEQFVRDWAREAGLECLVKRFDTRGYAASHGVSIEMAARELRYGWFRELMADGGFDAVAVAHNADDNAETMMLNLLRGTGTRGLRGMAYSRDGVVRPMLGISREEIVAWMREHGYAWREDSSNAEQIYKRNILRHRVFPVLREINPGFLGTLAADMEHIAQADDIAEDYFAGCRLDPDRIDIAALMGFRHWRYLLWRLTEGRLSADALAALSEALEAGGPASGKRFGPYVAGAGVLAFDSGYGFDPVTVSGPGIHNVGGRTVEVSLLEGSDAQALKADGGAALKAGGGILYADAAALPSPFVLRGWQDGDWMKPLGMRGRKKLSDLFTDLGWSVPMKREAILAAPVEASASGESASGSAPSGRVLALLGERIDESLRVTPDTGSIVRFVFL